MVSQLDGTKPSPTSPADMYAVGVVTEIASVESATSEATVIMARTIEVGARSQYDYERPHYFR